jgi:uncharacterized membrane protein YjjP (DUF1212 family)
VVWGGFVESQVQQASRQWGDTRIQQCWQLRLCVLLLQKGAQMLCVMHHMRQVAPMLQFACSTSSNSSFCFVLFAADSFSTPHILD